MVQILSVQSNQEKEKALLLGVATKDFMWEVGLEENVEFGLWTELEDLHQHAQVKRKLLSKDS